MPRRAARTDANQGNIVDALRPMWVCEWCGVSARWTVHQARQKYCSLKCMGEAQSARHQGEGNPNFKNAGWQSCRQCGGDFHSYNKTRKFCSHKCFSDSQKTLQPKTCKRCGEQFQPAYAGRKYCSKECAKRPARPKPQKIKRPPYMVTCEQCSTRFRTYPSANRRFCSYDCHLASGGARRAGDAAAMATKKYGAKRDANHKEIFDAMRAITAVHDLSGAGFGVPDGLAWIDGGWQLFDVKNPNTGYGKRGLNPRQKKWSRDWRGGPVFLIYTVEEAMKFARGDFCGLKRFPSGHVPTASDMSGSIM